MAIKKINKYMALADTYILSSYFVSFQGGILNNSTVTRQVPPTSGAYGEAWWLVQYNGQYDSGTGCIFGVLSSRFYGVNGSTSTYARTTPRWVVFSSDGDEYGPVQYPEIYNDSQNFTSPPLTGWRKESDNTAIALSISEPSPTPTPTVSITPSITPTRTRTPTPTVSITPSITPTRTQTPTPSLSYEIATTSQVTPTPTQTPTPTTSRPVYTISGSISSVPGYVYQGFCRNRLTDNSDLRNYIAQIYFTPANSSNINEACGYVNVPSLFTYNNNTNLANQNYAYFGVSYFPNQQNTDLRWASGQQFTGTSSYLNPLSAKIEGTGLRDLTASVSFTPLRRYQNYEFAAGRALYVRSFTAIDANGILSGLSKGSLVGSVMYDEISYITYNPTSYKTFNLSFTDGTTSSSVSSYSISKSGDIVVYLNANDFIKATPTPTPTTTPSLTPTRTPTPTPTKTPAVTLAGNPPATVQYPDNFRASVSNNFSDKSIFTSSTSASRPEINYEAFTYVYYTSSVGLETASNSVLKNNSSLSAFHVYTTFTSLITGLGTPVNAPRAQILLPYLEFRNVSNPNYNYTQSDVDDVQQALDNFSWGFIGSNPGCVAYLFPLSSLTYSLPSSANVVRVKLPQSVLDPIRSGQQLKFYNYAVKFVHLCNLNGAMNGSPFVFSFVTLPISGNNNTPGYDTTKTISFGLGAQSASYQLPASAQVAPLQHFVDENRNVYTLNTALLTGFDAFSNIRTAGFVPTLSYLNRSINERYNTNNISSTDQANIAGANSYIGNTRTLQITQPNTITSSSSAGVFQVSVKNNLLSAYPYGVTNTIVTNNVTCVYTVTAFGDNNGFSVRFLLNNNNYRLLTSAYNLSSFNSALGQIVLSPTIVDKFVFTGLGSVDFAVYTENDELNPPIILTPELQALLDAGAFDPWINPDLPYSGLWNFLRYKHWSG